MLCLRGSAIAPFLFDGCFPSSCSWRDSASLLFMRSAFAVELKLREHLDLPGRVKALGDVYSGEAQTLKTTRKSGSHVASAQAWLFLPWLHFPGMVLSAGSLGGWGALLCPASQRRTNVFFSCSVLSPLLLGPFICFLFLGICLPVYLLQQKTLVLLVVGEYFRRRFDLRSLALHIMRGRKFL